MLLRGKFGLAVVVLSTSLVAQQSETPPKFFPAVPIKAQSSSLASMQMPVDMESMPQVAPIFIEDGKTSSSVVIVNNSATNAGVAVMVYSLAGSPVSSTHRLLAPHEQQEISLKSLLIDLETPITAGSIMVAQDANLKGMTVISQVLITSNRGFPSYIDEELAMPSMSGSSTLRAVADQAVGAALLAVTNLEKSPQHVTLRCLSEKEEHKPATITLAPMATSLISSCTGHTVTDIDSYLQNISQHKEEGVQGYELVNDGGPGTIAAFGLAPHLRNQDPVFSAIPFTDPKTIKSANSVFAGVPFGPQPTLPDGVYKPRISLTNFGTSPAHVTVSIATSQENAPSALAASGSKPPERRVLNQLTIAPRRTIEVPLSDATSQSGLLQSLIIENDKNPGDILGKVVSRSDGTLYEIELLQKDQMDDNNGGIHPWSVEDDYQSHLLLFNYSDKPRTFSVGISNGAILWKKLYTLTANETREINFNQLIQDKIKDDDGQILAPDQQRGVVNWMVPDSGEGTGRLMVTSHSQAQARNFSCGQFIVVCGGYWYESNGLTVGQIGSVFNFVPQYCDEFSPSQCYGGSQVGSGSGNFNWGVGTSDIVVFSSSSQQYVTSWPQLYGVGPGSGYGNVQVTAGSCRVTGSGPAPVTPTLTLSPPLWFFGAGISAPSTFTLGNTQSTVTASGASGGTFTWTIPTGSTNISFASGSQVSSTTTSGNTVTVYSIGYSQSPNDTSIQLSWTPSGGWAINSSLALGVDSPYLLTMDYTTGPTAVADCSVHAAGNIGWWSHYRWRMFSTFGVQTPGLAVNENFTLIQNPQPNNWPFTPNGSSGIAGVSTFNDDFCFANQIAATPPTEAPQNPLTTNPIDSATQTYSIGSANVGAGLPVQTQILTRYVDHPTLTSVTTPVR